MKLFTLFSLVILVGCGSKQVTPKSVVSGPMVYAYGDSMTFGYGSSSGDTSYANYFSNDISRNLNNSSVSGSTLTQDQQYGVIMAAPQSTARDINVILPGYNDLRIYGVDPTHLALFTTNLTNALIKLSSTGSTTLVGTMVYTNLTSQALSLPNNTDANTDVYVNITKSVIAQLSATGYPVYLVDINAIFNQNTMVAPEDVHPSDFGYQVMSQEFLKVYNSIN